MKYDYRPLAAAGALMLAARAAVGCANDSGPGSDVVSENADAGLDGASSPEPDATTDGQPTTTLDAGDGGSDGSSCSLDGFCYAALPEAGSFDSGSVVPSTAGILFQLESVWVAPDHVAWAVSSTGHVLRWDGAAWSVVAIAPAALHSVWGSSSTDIWVAGDGGLVMHGTNVSGAVEFDVAPIATSETINHLWGRSATDVWAVGDKVYRLQSTGFVPVDLPSQYGDSGFLTLETIWGSDTDVWVSGFDTTFCDPVNCFYAERSMAWKWNGEGADPAWDALPVEFEFSNQIVAGTSTKDGVQLAAMDGNADDAFLVRVAPSDASASLGLDGGTTSGAYTWTHELVATYGSPTAIWATSQKDIWVAGRAGVVRHFDGLTWNVVRVALSAKTPLLATLRGMHAVVDDSGRRDLWIVGDDVALHWTEER